LKDDRLNLLRTAGLLHDIGKIAIDYAIIDKAGALTDEEYLEVKKHPEIGYRILKSSIEYEDIAKTVLYHHERIDGSGYPKGIREDEIPLESKIISIADAYDAMVSLRPYKKRKITKEEAIEELIRCSDTQFDGEIVKVFIEKVIK
jgi:putative nucleotidyltransferase with HDIG domain